jgi:hypothetical protein
MFMSDYLAFTSFVQSVSTNPNFTWSAMKALLRNSVKLTYPSLSATYYHRYDLKAIDALLTRYSVLV